ncbi:MAG TPA: YihY/virulence factor BrkB family protein [Bacteroidales bacterium]|jgi:membrane protein|nr:YihY/virulence factor BrkB family protein [Bacteroidales bacterium]
MSNPVTWSLDKIKRFNELIWHTPKKEISKWESFFFKQLRIIMLAARGFRTDSVQLRASAMTYYSLLSLVPIIAIAFAIAKGFGLDKSLEKTIIENARVQPEVIDWLLTNARTALSNTSGGLIAGAGVVILFWSVLSLLENIENSFNHIWQIRQARPWYRKFTDYFTFLLIAPIFLILSSSLTVYVRTGLTDFMDTARILAVFKPVITFLFKFAPYFLFWISMTILFIVMPNTKVRFVPALISGIIAGTILHLLQWVYFELQYGITKLNAIYGSFAFIPLFVIWMQASWIIVLLGAELCFANQNISRYEQEFESLNVSYYQKRALVLMILQRIIRNFALGEKPMSAESIAVGLNIPVRLARDILLDLNSVNLVSIIQDNGSEQRYQPSIDINKLTISYVFSRLDRKGSSQVTISKNEDYDKVVAVLDRFDRLIAKSNGNILIKDL